MFKIKKQILYTATLLLTLLHYSSSSTMHLWEINWSSAGVLPTFIDKNGEKQVVLTQERHTGKYDDCGGASEPYDQDPFSTATRELWEELMLEKTIGFSLETIRDYINVAKTDNTEMIIALLKKDKKTYGVTYIVDITPHIDQLCAHFYDALAYYQTEKSRENRKFREKSKIATVPWDALMHTIAQSNKTNSITIKANVINPITNIGQKKIIQLRPWLVIKLLPLAHNKPYTQGAHDKVRFYSWNQKNKVRCTSKKPRKPANHSTQL